MYYITKRETVRDSIFQYRSRVQLIDDNGYPYIAFCGWKIEEGRTFTIMMRPETRYGDLYSEIIGETSIVYTGGDQSEETQDRFERDIIMAVCTNKNGFDPVIVRDVLDYASLRRQGRARNPVAVALSRRITRHSGFNMSARWAASHGDERYGAYIEDVVGRKDPDTIYPSDEPQVIWPPEDAPAGERHE